MCQNATKTAADLMLGIRPTIVSLLTLEGLAGTPEATEALAAYDTAEQAVAAWVPGTTAQTIVEAVNAADAVFQALPVPDDAKALAGIIAAGFTAVVAIIEANSTTDATEQHEVTAAAVIKINTLAPHSFKYHKGIFAEFQASPEKQYHNAWNKQCEELGGKYLELKQAA